MYLSSGIYQIRNTINDNIYVGSAKCFRSRFSKHISALKQGKHHAKHLQAAWLKYGSEAFMFEPLLVCAQSDLIFFEQRCIDTLHPIYNSSPTAGNTLGVRCSLERRAKIAKAHTGKKLTPEHKAKIAPWGRKPSEATRQKLAAAQAKKTDDPEWRKKVSEGRKGLKLSAEHRAKLSASKKGKKPNLSEEVRLRKNKKIGEANRVRPISDAFRKNASTSQRKRVDIERFVFGDEQLTVLELADRFNLDRHVIRKRINAGWSIFKAVTTPVRSYGGNN